MENKDAMLMEFFTKVKNDCIYTKFAEQNHEIFVQIMDKFKEYAKTHFDTRVNDLQKLFQGDPKIVVPAQDVIKSELDALLPDIIKTHAWFLVEEIKKHADTMIAATQDASKQFVKQSGENHGSGNHYCTVRNYWGGLLFLYGEG